MSSPEPGGRPPLPEPERRPLPRRPDVRLTTIGLGGAQAGNLEGARDDAVVRATLDAAWDGGIRYVDTAPHYGLGLSERRLGALLRERPRDQVVLSTKVGRLLVPSPETADRQDGEFAVPADHRRVWDTTRDGIRRSIDDSLERLGLDRIDIAYLHDPDDRMAEALDVAIPALVELREEGVLRAVGAGMNHSAPLARIVAETDVDVVMCAGRYTLLDQTALADLLPLAQQQGVGVVVAAVYNSGLLATDRPPAGATFDYLPAAPELLARTLAIADVCERHGVTLPQVGVQVALAHPAVVSAVAGVRTAAEADQLIARATAPIPHETWAALRAERLIPDEMPTPT